jgi:hypothetical protein
MPRIVLLGLVTFLAATVALSEDFWITKEHMQWTDEEVKKLMTNSPWAKDVVINAPIAVLGVRGQRATGESGGGTDVESPGGGGGGRRGGRRRGGGGGDSGGGTEALLTLNISWRSALPLRKALVRSRLGAAAAVPPEAEQLINKDQEQYVIIVSGVPAAMARSLQNPALAEKSTIRAGKRAPVAAGSMDLQPRTKSVDVIYVFPKTPPIAADDKEVEVVLKLGPVEAKKKFNLKDMVYHGKLEL